MLSSCARAHASDFCAIPFSSPFYRWKAWPQKHPFVPKGVQGAARSELAFFNAVSSQMRSCCFLYLFVPTNVYNIPPPYMHAKLYLSLQREREIHTSYFGLSSNTLPRAPYFCQPPRSATISASHTLAPSPHPTPHQCHISSLERHPQNSPTKASAKGRQT